MNNSDIGLTPDNVQDYIRFAYMYKISLDETQLKNLIMMYDLKVIQVDSPKYEVFDVLGMWDRIMLNSRSPFRSSYIKTYLCWNDKFNRLATEVIDMVLENEMK
jgi:hypothetical protein